MVSIHELAVLSDAAYWEEERIHTAPQARGFGILKSWKGGGGATGGFYARAFKRGSQVVVAYSGTDDLRDVWDNLEFIRRIPKNQTESAIRFYDDINQGQPSSETEFIVTGHSLGGALAKHVLLERDSVVAAVAFNAPYVGGLKGVNRSMGNLIEVNSRGDPVSCFTENLGNFTIGETITLDVAPPGLLRRIVSQPADAWLQVIGKDLPNIRIKNGLETCRPIAKHHAHRIKPLIDTLYCSAIGRRTVP